MKILHIQLIAGGKATEKLDLLPVRQLRLAAFAKANKLGMAKMIERCIDFAISPEDEGPDLVPAEESAIIEFAAKQLIEESK